MICEHGNHIKMLWTSQGRETVEHVLVAFEGCSECIGIWVTDEESGTDSVHPVDGEWEQLENDPILFND